MRVEQPSDELQPVSRLDPKIAGLLAYLFGWVGGLVMFFTQTDRQVRFHAAQSIVVFGGLHLFLILWIAVMRPESGLIWHTLFWLSTFVLCGLIAALWGFLCVQAYMRVEFRIPGAANLTERLLKSSGHRGRHAKKL